MELNMVVAVLVVLTLLVGSGLVLLMTMLRRQRELQNDSISNRSTLNTLVTDLAHLRSGQMEGREAMKSLEAASKLADGRIGELVLEVGRIGDQQHALLAASSLIESQFLPALRPSDFLAHVSFEEFFAPPDIVVDAEKPTAKDKAWLSWLLGSSEFGIKVFESVKTLTERYGEFSPELAEKLASGAAKLMESTEGARWVVVQSGKIIGHGVMRTGAILAHQAASVFSSITLAAYILVARDTQKQLKSMNAVLRSLADEALWLRQSKLESTYESLRRVSQSGFALDRGTVLHLIKELHELRSFLRRKILAETPHIQEPGLLKGFFQRGKTEEARRKFFDKFHIELLQAHQVFRLEAFAVSLLNDPKMEAAFVRAVEEEAARLELMHDAMEKSWLGDQKHREEEVRPAILAEVSDLARLYNRGLSDARTIVIEQEEEIHA